MQVLSDVSLELVNRAVSGAKWVGAQQATAEDAGQEMALAILQGKRVESPRKYGKWLAMNATNPSRKKSNSEVAFSAVFAQNTGTGLDSEAYLESDQSIWLDAEEVCTVLEFTCLQGRFCDNYTLQELAEQNHVGINVIARAIKNALMKLKEVME